MRFRLIAALLTVLMLGSGCRATWNVAGIPVHRGSPPPAKAEGVSTETVVLVTAGVVVAVVAGVLISDNR